MSNVGLKTLRFYVMFVLLPMWSKIWGSSAESYYVKFPIAKHAIFQIANNVWSALVGIMWNQGNVKPNAVMGFLSRAFNSVMMGI